MKHFIFLSLASVFVFVCFGHAASILKESDNAKALRSVAASLEEPFEAGGGMVVPQKRYSSQYYTNMRSKQYDRAAMRNILKTMFVGKRMQASKRSPSADAIDVARDVTSLGFQPSDDVNAYVIMPSGLDSSVITALLQQLDSPRERLVTDRK